MDADLHNSQGSKVFASGDAKRRMNLKRLIATTKKSGIPAANLVSSLSVNDLSGIPCTLDAMAEGILQTVQNVGSPRIVQQRRGQNKDSSCGKPCRKCARIAN